MFAWLSLTSWWTLKYAEWLYDRNTSEPFSPVSHITGHNYYVFIFSRWWGWNNLTNFFNFKWFGTLIIYWMKNVSLYVIHCCRVVCINFVPCCQSYEALITSLNMWLLQEPHIYILFCKTLKLTERWAFFSQDGIWLEDTFYVSNVR